MVGDLNAKIKPVNNQTDKIGGKILANIILNHKCIILNDRENISPTSHWINGSIDSPSIIDYFIALKLFEHTLEEYNVIQKSVLDQSYIAYYHLLIKIPLKTGLVKQLAIWP